MHPRKRARSKPVAKAMAGFGNIRAFREVSIGRRLNENNSRLRAELSWPFEYVGSWALMKIKMHEQNRKR